MEETHLAVVLQGKVEGESNNTFSLGPTRDFQTLDDTGDALVFEARVLSLGVLTDDSEVDVGVARRESWERLAKDDRRVNVELLTHGNVPRHMSGLGDWSKQDTCETAIRSTPVLRNECKARWTDP